MNGCVTRQNSTLDSIIRVESVRYPMRKFNFSTSTGNLMRQKPDVSKIMADANKFYEQYMP